MRRDNTDLTAAAAATLIVAPVLLLAGVPVVPRVLAGLPLVFVLPGYALSALLVPAPPRQVNPALWRGLWIVGLSLTVTVLGGLLLDLTPAGLTRTSWTIALIAVTLPALAASAWLRGRRPGSAAASPAASPAVRAGPIAVAVAAVAVAAVAIGLALVSAGWQRTPEFAQLWLVPSRVAAAQGPAVVGQATLGVRSGYADAETFHLVLRRDTSTIGTWDFTLAAGQTWQQAIITQAGQHLTARLTTAGQPAASQTVHITSIG